MDAGAEESAMMLPSLFLSHGAPTLPLTDTPARSFLNGLGGRLPRPKAILVISAHWETESPVVSAVERNDTIHDFYGFPRRLYEITYPAPGAQPRAWLRFFLSTPKPNIAVLQRSIQPHLGPAHHLRLGRALERLRGEGVLIIGSGSLTHDLSEFRGQALDGPAPDWVTRFADWFGEKLDTARTGDLVDYRRQAPFAVKTQPSDEHLLPLFAALGAAGTSWCAEHLHASATYCILRMDVYAF